MTDKPLVAVSGASGYIALHVIRELLQRGYPVRGTLRDLARGEQVKQALAAHVEPTGLEFVAADLLADDGWGAAVADCRYLLHLASPLPLGPPKEEDELIAPARDGAVRALRAAAEAGVERVVMTSSVAAVIYDNSRQPPFDEDSWSDPARDIGAYAKSKTLAERAAWAFMDELPAERPMELVTINPSLVLGPLLDPDGSASVEAVRKMLARDMPGLPRIGFGIVDVRDVATAHVEAMTEAAAAGRRYICSGEFVWLGEIARILAEAYGDRGYRVPRRELPNWAVRLAALFDPTVRLVTDQLGLRNDFDTTRIQEDLHWQARPVKETVLDTADSLIAHGLV
ncbi:MAG: aldehyde reductase [Alphaproteobacteria bacterium]|jgi:nucleoside-diphosphate-sugar epimerase|nr:aldehyde reductase [Alphaproteobacteria bacterium]MDP6567858.1 aldehyde reductase [Alphaproteobacteria bacterium]MDP6815738.1 aldehyde reductase [Alphaproteobacteria bacterium]